MSVNFDKYLKDNRVKFKKKQLSVYNSFQGRCPRQKPRDPIEERLLIESTIRRWKRFINSGELTEIAPRIWRWRI